MFENIKKAESRKKALAVIQEAFADMEDATDVDFYIAYLRGLMDMACTLGAITHKECAGYAIKALSIEQALKAKKEPVYKKKGVYEYNGYYILKDFAADAGAGSACWCVKQMGAEELIAKGLTFKEAVKVIDEV